MHARALPDLETAMASDELQRRPHPAMPVVCQLPSAATAAAAAGASPVGSMLPEAVPDSTDGPSAGAADSGASTPSTSAIG